MSCAFNSDNTTYNLGNNYYFLADANESQILLNLKPSQRSKVGRTIVPAEVIEYNFNELYIIAKSVDNRNKAEFYWIVNKHAKENVQPSNFKDFTRNLRALKIDLELEPRK